MIRTCKVSDFNAVWSIINDGAGVYRGVIPADRWTEPYMSRKELRDQMEDGVAFSGYEKDGVLVAVMGIQSVQDITLIRHAYVRMSHQKHGIGSRLLAHLRGLASTPILIGTWADASWAIRFYEQHGFRMVNDREKDILLRRYWSVPERQIETSVVLADAKWRDEQSANSFLR